MKEQIRIFIGKETFTDIRKIGDETQLFEEGIFDSMGLLNLISFLETEFNIKVADSELDTANFGSLNAIVSFLDSKVKSGLCAELPGL
jgi:acyl carrier protein